MFVEKPRLLKISYFLLHYLGLIEFIYTNFNVLFVRSHICFVLSDIFLWSIRLFGPSGKCFQEWILFDILQLFNHLSEYHSNRFVHFIRRHKNNPGLKVVKYCYIDIYSFPQYSLGSSMLTWRCMTKYYNKLPFQSRGIYVMTLVR